MKTLRHCVLCERVVTMRTVQISFLEQKTRHVQASCDKAQSNADKFSKLLSSSEEAAAKSRKEYHESLRHGRHEYELLQQASAIKHRELEARLASTEETQRHTSAEMRQFLTKQQQVPSSGARGACDTALPPQIGSRWRDEAHQLAAQYEDRMGKLAVDLDGQVKKNGELISLLHDAKQKILEVALRCPSVVW